MHDIGRDKILFVGAGGAIASKVLPGLASSFDIVGIGGRRHDLADSCVEFVGSELTLGHERIFQDLFSRHIFSGIVWNVVRYHPAPLIETSRGTLHLEFDLGIALPLACLSIALQHGFSGTIVLMTSGLAFGMKPSWGSYSIVKRGQVIIAEYLSAELVGTVSAKAVAVGSIADVPSETLVDVLSRALRDTDEGKIVYRAYGPSWD